MRTPSARVLRNTVQVQPVQFVADDDGGRQAVPYGPPSAPIRCRVHPSSAKDVPAHQREEGVEYLTVHFFGSSPGTRTRDQIAWLDWSPPRQMTAIGPPRSPSGELTTFLVDCEYRVPPQPVQS
jgi:hypothetical protein